MGKQGPNDIKPVINKVIEKCVGAGCASTKPQRTKNPINKAKDRTLKAIPNNKKALATESTPSIQYVSEAMSKPMVSIADNVVPYNDNGIKIQDTTNVDANITNTETNTGIKEKINKEFYENIRDTFKGNLPSSLVVVTKCSAKGSAVNIPSVSMYNSLIFSCFIICPI